jgi:hypothetical protein
VLFADKSENIYLLTKTGEDVEAKLLLEKKVGTVVKCLYLLDDIVTIIQSDTTSKETIMTTVNLTRLHEDEEEKRLQDEELKKKEAEEEEKKNTMSDQDFRLWKMQQQ